MSLEYCLDAESISLCLSYVKFFDQIDHAELKAIAGDHKLVNKLHFSGHIIKLFQWRSSNKKIPMWFPFFFRFCFSSSSF